MGMFGDLPPEEMERRRAESIRAKRDLERAEFAEWYQKQCDTDYWRNGKCCAGCDHWASDAGNSGECTAAGIVSGAEVALSMGITGASFSIEPGFPMTRADFVCGKFRDDFDWSTLPQEYLKAIGAVRNGKLRSKP